MRIREVYFRDFRSFRGERRISFVDPLTDAVRPVTVLAGSNGSGKTTIFDTIEALFAFLHPSKPTDLLEEAWDSGLIAMTVEPSPQELGQIGEQPNSIEPADRMVIAVGKHDLLSTKLEKEWPNLFCRLLKRGSSVPSLERSSPLAEKMQRTIIRMERGIGLGRAEMHGGLLYFPHDRRLSVTSRGVIDPPPEKRLWRFRFKPADQWQGSLEQLWVWQNYLDLEQGTSGRQNLKPFVETVEGILGERRRITIKEGRVLVPPSWSTGQENGNLVRLDQLPSGEQQMLLLFGELARQRRPGAVIAIDEVENSLHPALQRKAVHQLRQYAREWDSQLILATHSLEVLRAVHESERIILDQLEPVESVKEA